MLMGRDGVWMTGTSRSSIAVTVAREGTVRLERGHVTVCELYLNDKQTNRRN